MSDHDRFDEAIEQLMVDESPRQVAAKLTPVERQMLLLAQRLRGASGQEPSTTFTGALHDRVFSPVRRISRRTAFLSGISAMAAGILAGVGLDRVADRLDGNRSTQVKIAADNGKWHPVAMVADVPPGAIHRFSAGAVQGFLINHDGEYRALSAICTHMGCALRFERSEQSFLCPCHGAEFDTSGRLRFGPGGYRHQTGQSIPPLPTISVRLRGDSIEVYGT